MKRQVIIGFAGWLLTGLTSGPALAWYHAGHYGTASGGGGSWSAQGWRGGSASGSGGSWSGTGWRGSTASGSGGSWNAQGYRGGSASGGGGSWNATGAYGGTASGSGGYWHATNSYGTTVYGSRYGHYYGGYYPTYYHPPTVVNTYYGSGCSDCGGWSTAGAAAVGLAAGTAIGAASANAYAAGVAAGSAYAMGAIYPTLPAGCAYMAVGGGTYYSCGGTWLKPMYGANGLYYRVVPNPY
jgi:hypothetical protein